MIPIKNERELVVMRQACKITAAARALAGEMVRPGVTTKAIDKAVHDFIVAQGAKPSFLHYSGYPASACISVNDVVIHGIPDGYKLKEGDIVSVDVGACWKGFHGDCAATFACGRISPTAQKLIDVTKESFFEGLKFARQGYRISDISHAVQSHVEKNGFSVVRAFVGHGVGENLHEEPEVPNGYEAIVDNYDPTDAGDYELTVTNKRSIPLPDTGAGGDAMFVAVGVGLLLLGLTLTRRRRPRKGER